MHRQFRKLLDEAAASLEFAVVVNVDIRGFSSFSTRVESPNATMFIKRVYKKLIDNYFSNASFFKATGDGLLIIVPYGENELQQIVTSTVDACVKAVNEFPSFCSGDPMINFEVPDKVGIGMSRDIVCCLRTPTTILDYSGRCLNLASRLMDMARPSGIVFDGNFGLQLLPDSLSKKFAKESVYIRGMSEKKPVDVYYTRDYTQISEMHKRPIEAMEWEKVMNKWSLKKIRELRSTFNIYLPSQPMNTAQIQVKVKHPSMLRGKKQRGIETVFSFAHFTYEQEAGAPIVRLDMKALATMLSRNGVKADWDVEVEIRYPK